jgi:hypothetical protein
MAVIFICAIVRVTASPRQLLPLFAVRHAQKEKQKTVTISSDVPGFCVSAAWQNPLPDPSPDAWGSQPGPY